MSDSRFYNSEDESFEIKNPYRPYDFASAKWFYHQDIITKIKELFETQPDNRIILLQGKPFSGKSAILKRIEDTPTLLGENYIPIYLDCSQYIKLDANDLFYSVSEDIIDQLNRLGFPISMPNEIKKRQINDSAFESLLLRFDISLESDKVLLLLFDEFDTLLENVDVNIIAQYIRLSKNIERSWDNYGLILAGDKPLVNLTNSDTINAFLENNSQIMIKRTADKETVRTFITEPVKNILTYDEDAMNRIMWYSGRNLYFQQLICFYIVNHLNEKIRRRYPVENGEEPPGGKFTFQCSAEDVETAVRQILSEQIPDFFYVWDKKLTLGKKVLASALADKTVTEKKGSHYILKPIKLLDNILGNDIYMVIEELQDSGYINKMQQQYYRDSPFVVPLHGKWIEREHPFLKVVMEHIEDIADKIDLSLMVEKVKETPQDQLTPFKKETILDIAEKWCMLKNRISKQRKTADRNQVTTFIQSVCHQLNLSLKQKPRSNENHCILDIKSLDTWILEEALCFIQDKPGFKPGDIFKIESRASDFVQHAHTRLTILFYFQPDEMVEALAKKPYLNLISLDENDIKKIIFSEMPVESFKKIILSRLSLSKISPYQTAGPTTTIFYGRSRIINRMINASNKSFALIGARKIGKTSLLLKLKENHPPDAIYLFIDMQAVLPDTKKSQKKEEIRKRKSFIKKIGFPRSPYNALFINFVLEIEKIFKKRFYPVPLPFSDDLSRLKKVLRKLPGKGKRIIFIIDEIDALIEIDRKNGWRLLRLFRSMSQANYCQFIFAGINALHRYKREIENPLYNFCEEIKLEPLDKKSAVDLITKPMEKIGIHYHNKNDTDFILDYTGSHPNLVQFFCQQLLETIDRHEDMEARRTIFFNDINQLFDFVYEEYIMDEVYMFSTDLSKMDQLILILLAEEHSNGNGKVFSINEICQKIKDNGIHYSKDEIHQHVRNLVMRFILLDNGKNRYSFALSIFPGILKKRIDNEFKQEIIEEIKANVS
jgi:Cdc6-like AAA superfamily ATPase